MLNFDCFPVEAPLQTFGAYEKRSSRNLKGPLRVVRLCILGVVVPTLILGVPLYLRYNVYGAQLYPLAMSDMRMIDNRVSTTWCQVKKNHFVFASPDFPLASKLISMLTSYLGDFKAICWFACLESCANPVQTA